MACSRQGSQTISVTANTRNGLSMGTRFSRDLVQNLILSAEATVAASISLIDTIRVWDFRIGMCMSTIENSRLNPAIRYCSPQILSTLYYPRRTPQMSIDRKTIQLWDATSAQLLGHFALPMADRTFITSRASYDKIQNGRGIAISPKNRFVSLVHYDQETEMCAWREKWGSQYVWSMGNTLTGKAARMRLHCRHIRVSFDIGLALVSTRIGNL